jgi:glycosyltransferase involved in cell wall biosynthesis
VVQYFADSRLLLWRLTLAASIDVSIISPVHNEELSLTPLVERTVAVMENYPHIKAWEHILVDDGSTDSSWRIMQDLQARFPDYVRIVQHPQRMGQKQGYYTGFQNARGWLSILMDADLQVLPEELPLVLDKAVLNNFEMVCTYSDQQRGGKHRGLVSLIGNMLFMKLIFNSPVRDATANFMAVQTRYLRGVELIDNDQRYIMPIAMRRGLTRIGEVGCVFAVREHGKSKYSKWKKILQGVPEMLVLKRRLASGFYDEPRPEVLNINVPAQSEAR